MGGINNLVAVWQTAGLPPSLTQKFLSFVQKLTKSLYLGTSIVEHVLFLKNVLLTNNLLMFMQK